MVGLAKGNQIYVLNAMLANVTENGRGFNLSIQSNPGT